MIEFSPDLWWVGAAGVVAPYVISYLKSDDWSVQRKRLFSLVVSAALGVVVAVTTAGWSVFEAQNIDVLASNAASVWAAGQLAFHFLVKGTALETSASLTPPGIVQLRRPELPPVPDPEEYPV